MPKVAGVEYPVMSCGRLYAIWMEVAIDRAAVGFQRDKVLVRFAKLTKTLRL